MRADDTLPNLIDEVDGVREEDVASVCLHRDLANADLSADLLI
jgi:hypothetical protein